MPRTRRTLRSIRGTAPGPLPSVSDVVVLSLAAARLARAVSVDDISEPARERMAAWAGAADAPGWGRWADRLIHCPLCTGFWLSLGVSLAAPGRSRVLRGLAVAGGQVMWSLAERLVSEEGRAAIHTANAAAVVDPLEPVAP